MNKIYQPGECIKYMYVELHPVLLHAWYCSDVQREMTAVGARLSSSDDMCDPALVMWARALQPELACNDGQVQLSPTKQRCRHALYVLPAEEAAPLVLQHSLAKHLVQISEMVQCPVTLVLFGVNDYFKSRTKQDNSSRMTDIDLEMAITDLIVSASCDAVKVNTPNELALLIVQFTKAIAAAPYKQAKRECDEQAEFYMRGDNKQCIAIDKDGQGMSRLWQQMVAIMPQSSLETSRAICAKYKTPRALYEALQSSNAVNEIADVGVARAAVPGAKTRRVGPEFARKLHTLFTADDGNLLLD